VTEFVRQDRTQLLAGEPDEQRCADEQPPAAADEPEQLGLLSDAGVRGRDEPDLIGCPVPADSARSLTSRQSSGCSASPTRWPTGSVWVRFCTEKMPRPMANATTATRIQTEPAMLLAPVTVSRYAAYPSATTMARPTT
jgi:hypothetical protein